MQLQRDYGKFQKNGVEVVALAVASASSVRGIQKRTQVTYPMLADPTHQVASDYGVYNLLNDNLAAPSVFIIDTDGRIVWSRVGRNAGDRPSVKTILEHLP